MASIHTIQPHQKRTSRKRVGRGNASGHGTYSGRGQKGQRSRSGGKSGLKRMGLKQYLLQIPKVRGFKRPSDIIGININVLSSRFTEGAHVTVRELVKEGLIPRVGKVKILGHGNITKKLSVSVHAISQSAQKAIEKAGGTVSIIKK